MQIPPNALHAYLLPATANDLLQNPQGNTDTGAGVNVVTAPPTPTFNGTLNNGVLLGAASVLATTTGALLLSPTVEANGASGVITGASDVVAKGAVSVGDTVVVGTITGVVNVVGTTKDAGEITAVLLETVDVLLVSILFAGAALTFCLSGSGTGTTGFC